MMMRFGVCEYPGPSQARRLEGYPLDDAAHRRRSLSMEFAVCKLIGRNKRRAIKAQ